MYMYVYIHRFIFKLLQILSYSIINEINNG